MGGFFLQVELWRGGFVINGAGFSASLQLKDNNSFTKMFLWIFLFLSFYQSFTFKVWNSTPCQINNSITVRNMAKFFYICAEMVLKKANISEFNSLHTGLNALCLRPKVKAAMNKTFAATSSYKSCCQMRLISIFFSL